MSKGVKKDNWKDDISDIEIDHPTVDYMGCEGSYPARYKNDKFKELFAYGDSSPFTRYTNDFSKAHWNEVLNSTQSVFFNFIVKDHYGEKRVYWNKDIKKKFNKIYECIPETVYQTLRD